MSNNVVKDYGTPFVFDGTTKQITNSATRKPVLVKGDHNCEQFTFECSRYVEGYDLSKCTKIEIHYINGSREKSAGIYTVEDAHIGNKLTKPLTFTWLLSKNATKYEGVLSFKLRFVTLNGEEIEYELNSEPYAEILVADTQDNSEDFEETNIDIIEQWKNSVMEELSTQMIRNVDIAVETRTSVLEARMDTFTKMSNNGMSTAAEAELYDIRVGADGTKYNTAAEAVRGQVGKLSKEIVSFRRTLTRDDDLDTLLENGRYNWVSNNMPKNCPYESGGGVVFVYEGGNKNIPTLHAVQVIMPANEAKGCYIRVGTSSGLGNWLNVMDNSKNNLGVNRKKNFVITEFDMFPYWYNTIGEYDLNETHFHSQLIPVSEGRTYYIGWKLANQVYSGAFFDNLGNWIAPLIPDDITVAEYQYPDGTGYYPNDNITYAEIYQFTAPEGACFFSWNLRMAESVKYKQYISTMPVFALSESGNYAWDDDFPPYQATKDKSLCVIGASGVMIDRLFRQIPSGSNQWQHVIGFQEYLVPWYKNVESYGFSSGSWRKNEGASDLSIYNGIVTAGVDLSGYDEFLLRHSNSGLNLSNVGDITTDDVDTYIGGMKAVIDYIYSASPHAKIYVSGIGHSESYYTDEGTKTLVDTVIQNTRALCAIRGCHYIDPTDNQNYSGNVNLYTYDGKHANQEGSKKIGLFYRKIMVGI